MRRFLLVPAVLLIGAVFLPACSPSHDSGVSKLSATTSVARPDLGSDLSIGSAEREFFPLQHGNRWQFRYRFAMTVDPDPSGSYDEVYVARHEHLIVCREDRGDLAYDVARVSSSDANVIPYWIRYRQDRDGLYEYDDTGGPPACDTDVKRIGAPSSAALPGDQAWSAAATRLGLPARSAAWEAAWQRLREKRASLEGLSRALGAGPAALATGEIQRLAYPLRPGQAWQIRPEMNFRCVVERAVMLRTPAGWFPAWSIRIYNDALGADDVVRTWYGRDGYLGYEARLAGEATDENGNPVGTIHARQSETLVGIRLMNRHRRPIGHAPGDALALDR